MRRPMDMPQRRGQAADVADRPVYDGFATAAGPVPATRRDAPPAPAGMPGKTAGATATRRASAFAGHVDGVAERLGALSASRLRDELTDGQAMQIAGFGDDVPDNAGAGQFDGFDGVEPRNPENLPAVIGQAVAESGDGMIVPQWHMVRHLPGYLQQPIRALGRMVFRQFTDTPVEDIQTCTTLSNRVDEVKALMGWISRNGIRDDQAEMDFEGTIPDYKAETQVWNVQGYTFLLVKDFAGHYVYGWPGGRGVHLEHEPRPLLR